MITKRIRHTAVLAPLVGLLLALGPAVSAHAATSTTTAPAASCASDPKQNAETLFSVWQGNVDIMLRYSPTCRTAWAARGGDGAPGDEIWVWNENTGATQSAWYPAWSTGVVDDAGTQSHACYEGPGVPKFCTPFA
ncbi:DUF2690 domain-containing protein [Kitasatospora sp. NPDC008050]|uniref:DUF2690 domain-containing protein n=1 Tax=Kitasatospora sp. NPDC008050 TaxID=3364021 RepID=UPI0036E83DD6